ncbi:hemin uptake protein HemP [Burkholderiaceae bacterium UC74_6]
MPSTTPPPSRPAPVPVPIPAAPRLSSEKLFAGRREIEIEHAGQVYRLRMTALGKLILTK